MNKKKFILKKWSETFLEIFKWGVVLWLLLPIRHASQTPVNFLRVTVGMALFIIFTGKIFYDLVVEGLIKKKRDNLKKDLITLIGILLIIGLVVGFLIFFISFYVVESAKMINQN
ncbi:MAG: hypothetical protein R6V04_16790 [bacterium]